MKKKKVIIMGAAGRDFHNFNMLFREDPEVEVVAFTAAQIPFIEKRLYPAELAGPAYPEGIPIHPEAELGGLIVEHGADTVVFSYSDVPYQEVMHAASLASSLGAEFVLPNYERTLLECARPVISVTAVRTGCGKSGVTRFVSRVVSEGGKKPVAVRHPMPYGELAASRVQRFSSAEDLREADLTIEELEEYEPLVEAGVTVFAGVDYREVLSEAEKEADVIIWDGGNNDTPFVRPDLDIVVADPLRPGHELAYWPGEVNLRRSGCVVINKANSATAEGIETVRDNTHRVNPDAGLVLTSSVVTVEGDISGKHVLVIEDGPSLTHGGMPYGAGTTAAMKYGATAVKVRPHATGSIREALENYPHLKNVLPAMGYSEEQRRELKETIESTPCDLVLVATPVDLERLIDIEKPTVRVRYEVRDIESRSFAWELPGGLRKVVTDFLEGLE